MCLWLEEELSCATSVSAITSKWWFISCLLSRRHLWWNVFVSRAQWMISHLENTSGRMWKYNLYVCDVFSMWLQKKAEIQQYFFKLTFFILPKDVLTVIRGITKDAERDQYFMLSTPLCEFTYRKNGGAPTSVLRHVWPASHWFEIEMVTQIVEDRLYSTCIKMCFFFKLHPLADVQILALNS